MHSARAQPGGRRWPKPEEWASPNSSHTLPERFDVKRTQAREFFDELQQLSERELKRCGEFVLPGMVKLVVQNRKARMGRNPATGEAIKIPAKTVVKARIAKQLKDSVLS